MQRFLFYVKENYEMWQYQIQEILTSGRIINYIASQMCNIIFRICRYDTVIIHISGEENWMHMIIMRSDLVRIILCT